MTRGQAEEFVEVLVAAFPGAWPPITKGLYAERMMPYRADSMSRAVDTLITTRNKRPTIADVIGAAQNHEPPKPAKPWPPQLPLTAAEWRELGEQLGAAADDSAAAGRVTAPNLARLCEFYLENADLVAAGKQPLWPPPGWAGEFGQVLGAAACGEVPKARKLTLVGGRSAATPPTEARQRVSEQLRENT